MGFPQIAERDADEKIGVVPLKADGALGSELAAQQYAAAQQQYANQRNVAEEASAALQLLMTALGALSKRTLIALSSLFTMLTVGSAFVLWFSTPHPDVYQLFSLGMYALFILAINYIARK